MLRDYDRTCYLKGFILFIAVVVFRSGPISNYNKTNKTHHTSQQSTFLYLEQNPPKCRISLKAGFLNLCYEGERNCIRKQHRANRDNKFI